MHKQNKHSLLAYFIIFLLVVGSLLLFWPHNNNQVLEDQITKIEKNLHKKLNQLEIDGEILISAAKKDSINFSIALEADNHPFVVYNNGNLVFWNNNIIVPEYKYITGNYNFKFLRIPDGIFIARKWNVNEYTILGLLPLYRSTKISNRYISSHYNKGIFPFTPAKIREATGKSKQNICIRNECFFKVEINTSSISSVTAAYDHWGSIILLVAFFLIIFVFFRNRALFISRYGLPLTVFIMSLSLVIPRLIMLWTYFPRDHIKNSLFDSTAFASSWLNPTLGDLILNLVLILLISVFVFLYRTSIIEKIKASKIKLFSVVSFLLFFFFLSLILYLLVQTIYHNSQISLDINRDFIFNFLRVSAYLALLIVAVIAFLIGHIAIRLLNELFTKDEALYIIGGVVLSYVIIAFIDKIVFLIPIVVTASFIIIVSLSQLFKSLLKIRFATYIYVLTWAVCASIIIAFSTVNSEEDKEYNNQEKFAEKFLVENDALAEFLLYDLNQKILNDLFIQSRLSSPYLGKDVIKDKIRQVYLSDYFNKYDINIYLFDSQGRPFNPIDFMLRPSDIKLNNKKYQTSYKNIYYIDESGDEFAGRYLDLIEIKKRGLRVGYILLDLRLKKLIPESVYPELLVDRRFLQTYQNKAYSYAVFKDRKIIYSSGKFNYNNNFSTELFQKNKIFLKGVERDGYQHIAIEDAEGNYYVVSVPAHTAEHFFSNFSFFFLLIVLVVTIISLIYAILFLIRGNELYYSARIQLYLSLSFFIPMLVVTLITLSLVSKSFKEEVIRENVKKAEIIATNIAEDVIHEPYANQLVTILNRASRYANADANIFTPTGELLATSQPMIYENNLLAPYINPQAIININYGNEQLFTADEAVGQLQFKTTYHGIRSTETGNLIGILSVPFFQSEAALEKHQIDIFTNVINIFTISFLIFLLVAYLASEYLTFPLKIITRKLQKTSLEFNEPLSWEANDEIGLMVREYNKMVENLEESKIALAKSEKESAWREMAQQVAHEIKNPLTPMKLTLQHMQRTFSDGDGKDPKIKKSINTLLQQVNILSEIAGSFSAFASMPSPSKEKFDIQQQVLNSTSLFSNTEGIKLQVHTVNKPLIVEADEKLMGRIISNIIINAIEAGEGYQPLKIDIKLEVQPDETVQLSIADNGPGIEDTVREKIFMPHFSTKRRGSGIGLAIARRGVEHAGGSIWFETKEGEGTTFFILLPLANV